MASSTAEAYSRDTLMHLKHGRLVAAALATVSLVCFLTFGAFMVFFDGPFLSAEGATLPSIPQLQPHGAQKFEDHNPHLRSAVTTPRGSHAIVMSCPVARTKTHDGPWKPRNLARGAEAVVRQLVALNVSIPFFYAYYKHEQSDALPFCRSLAADVADALVVHCFLVPEPYPTGQYGYAKIFALKHVPIRHVLWFDCDAFPIRDPSPLFVDPEYRKAGAMYVYLYPVL